MSRHVLSSSQESPWLKALNHGAVLWKLLRFIGTAHRPGLPSQQGSRQRQGRDCRGPGLYCLGSLHEGTGKVFAEHGSDFSPVLFHQKFGKFVCTTDLERITFLMCYAIVKFVLAIYQPHSVSYRRKHMLDQLPVCWWWFSFFLVFGGQDTKAWDILMFSKSCCFSVCPNA